MRSADSAEWEDGRGRGRRRRHRPWPGDDVRQGALESGVAAAGDEAAWGDSEGLGGQLGGGCWRRCPQGRARAGTFLLLSAPARPVPAGEAGEAGARGRTGGAEPRSSRPCGRRSPPFPGSWGGGRRGLRHPAARGGVEIYWGRPQRGDESERASERGGSAGGGGRAGSGGASSGGESEGPNDCEEGRQPPPPSEEPAAAQRRQQPRQETRRPRGPAAPRPAGRRWRRAADGGLRAAGLRARAAAGLKLGSPARGRRMVRA